jgi:hypothetical protein
MLWMFFDEDNIPSAEELIIRCEENTIQSVIHK